MSGTPESVVRMANQIARNLAVQGEAGAIDATAEHIALFWDPRMKAQAYALLSEPDSGFSKEARAALEKLRESA